MTAHIRLGCVLMLGMLAGGSTVTSQERAPSAAKTLTVELQGGRKFTGHVDPRTSDQNLILRFTRGTAFLTRKIEWPSVVQATVEGQPIEAAKLREIAEGMKLQEKVNKGQEIPNPKSQFPIPPPAEPPLPRVTAVTFDARLANWDSDVETDGLVVDLYPITAAGALAAIDGTVEVELFAPQLRVFHHAPLSGGQTIERVERWTSVVSADQLAAGGARLKLPFGAVHPEFDLDWLNPGLVHVRLVVPGDGVFEDSQDALRIRPYTPLRDRLEHRTGERFLPTEAVGRHD